MTKFFNKLKKSCFWPISGLVSHFLGQNIFFPENLPLSRTTSYGFLEPCQNLEKANNSKKTPRQTEGLTDPIFHRTLPVTAGGPIIT